MAEGQVPGTKLSTVPDTQQVTTAVLGTPIIKIICIIVVLWLLKMSPP